jgi:phosphate transport system permease protein
MSVNPETYAAFLDGGDARAAMLRRRRRERFGALAVSLASALVLLGLLAIPLFLTVSVVSWTPLAAGAWAHLGVLFAGSLKAAICALVVAVPVGLGAAVFTAEFASPRFRGWFKPSLELLEAIPTVVLGLVATATLAPWLKTHVATLLAMVVLIPALLVFGGIAIGSALRPRHAWLPIALVPALAALVVAISYGLGPFDHGAIEPASPWNGVLIGLALGFAAVPLVFSIGEDALTLIPATHVQAALALGATRWQALRSIVLPVARSGLVAAIVLAASRCIGETMIVLMASGNSPIASADPLTGLRTISAEIALALPETAPPGDPYRALLLAALALFALTFVLNLAAAAARGRLHRRAARALAFA